jgi:hypothetical protein
MKSDTVHKIQRKEYIVVILRAKQEHVVGCATMLFASDFELTCVVSLDLSPSLSPDPDMSYAQFLEGKSSTITTAR